MIMQLKQREMASIEAEFKGKSSKIKQMFVWFVSRGTSHKKLSGVKHHD